MNFSDIPQHFVDATDELDEDGQIVLFSIIAEQFMVENEAENLAV
ncbi:hypothetical protein [Fortiea contorta]|nr:hypothetical protein [Fortiea contorta]